MNIVITNPSLVAVAGDFHGNTRHAVAAVHWAADRNVEAIVHTGDFGFRFDDEFVDSLDTACADFGIPLYFVRGNHDSTEYLRNLPVASDGTRPISAHLFWLPDGHRWTWGGKVWLGLGGAVSVDRNHRMPMVSWWADEVISVDDAERACIGGKVDYMVTHDVPAGAAIPGINEKTDKFWPTDVIYESNLNRDVLRSVVDEVRPEVLYHGHYHRRYTSNLNGTIIEGLDMDGKIMSDNMMIVRINEG